MAKYYALTAETTHKTLAAAKAAEIRALRKEGGGNGGIDKITKDGAFFYRTVQTNAGRKRKKKKMSGQKRVSAALSRWVKKQNPALKNATHVRVKKLKNGGVSIVPAKPNTSRRKYKKQWKKDWEESLPPRSKETRGTGWRIRRKTAKFKRKSAEGRH